MTDPAASMAIRFVWPYPLPVMTIALLFLSMVTSAIIGLPTISVAVSCGNWATLAWSRVTAITPVPARAGVAPAATRNAAASQRRDGIESPLSAHEIGSHFARQ